MDVGDEPRLGQRHGGARHRRRVALPDRGLDRPLDHRERHRRRRRGRAARLVEQVDLEHDRRPPRPCHLAARLDCLARRPGHEMECQVGGRDPVREHGRDRHAPAQRVYQRRDRAELRRARRVLHLGRHRDPGRARAVGTVLGFEAQLAQQMALGRVRPRFGHEGDASDCDPHGGMVAADRTSMLAAAPRTEDCWHGRRDGRPSTGGFRWPLSRATAARTSISCVHR